MDEFDDTAGKPSLTRNAGLCAFDTAATKLRVSGGEIPTG